MMDMNLYVWLLVEKIGHCYNEFIEEVVPKSLAIFNNTSLIVRIRINILKSNLI